MSKYHEYYDLLNLGKKDYEGEIKKVKEIFEKNCNLPLNKVLEIGCGTGNHTKELLKISNKVFACDIDSEMIKIAKLKVPEEKVYFHTSSVPDIVEQEFPLCVLMWNVINYFPTISLMNKIFSEIKTRMLPGGLIMFDMWNGVTAIRDPPSNAVSRIEKEGLRVIHTLESRTNLMEQKTTIKNRADIIKNEMLVDSFSEEVTHYLWTFKTIKDILDLNEMETIGVFKSNNWDEPANEKDWKIFILAKKK
ncbi:class I SAM-dependent methyltransferase [Candidatus Pacearchaeota archaeon]|nr:class I SAM-dependent methyltransferase [Candidatus Pacearchaeota archaeon]